MNTLTLVALGLSIAAPGAKEPEKKADAPSILGSWDAHSMSTAGKADQGIPTGGMAFEFTADGKLNAKLHGKPQADGEYKLNTKASPGELDFNIGGGADFHKAIFKIEKDTLTLCWDDAGGPRPKEFGVPAKSKIAQMTFKRREAKKE